MTPPRAADLKAKAQALHETLEPVSKSHSDCPACQHVRSVIEAALSEVQQETLKHFVREIMVITDEWHKDINSWPPFSDGGQCARKAIAKCRADIGGLTSRLKETA